MARILVIDDDAGVRGAIRKALTAAGHDVLEASDGAHGVEVYRTHQPDLILTDVYMPGGNGLEAVVRVISEYPGARVVVMSGGGWQTVKAVLDQATNLGAAAVLPKPFDVDDLMRAVDGALPADG